MKCLRETPLPEIKKKILAGGWCFDVQILIKCRMWSSLIYFSLEFWIIILAFLAFGRSTIYSWIHMIFVGSHGSPILSLLFLLMQEPLKNHSHKVSSHSQCPKRHTRVLWHMLVTQNHNNFIKNKWHLYYLKQNKKQKPVRLSIYNDKHWTQFEW